MFTEILSGKINENSLETMRLVLNDYNSQPNNWNVVDERIKQERELNELLDSIEDKTIKDDIFKAALGDVLILGFTPQQAFERRRKEFERVVPKEQKESVDATPRDEDKPTPARIKRNKLIEEVIGACSDQPRSIREICEEVGELYSIVYPIVKLQEDAGTLVKDTSYQPAKFKLKGA